MDGRSITRDAYRYGFQGQEKVNQISGDGNTQFWSGYLMDSRLGRRWQIDPEWERMANQSPYSVLNNSPVSFEDPNGNWAVFIHYKMTKKALREAGFSRQTAKKIAHYASTYADNPSGGVTFLNQVLGIFAGVNPLALSKNEKKYGSYDLESQDDGQVKMVSIHAMQAYWEDITDEEAMNRALRGGEFEQKDEDGNVIGIIKIEGALNTIERYKGKDPKEMTEAEQKELGVAFHTIQDAEAHTGGKWAAGKEHKEHAEDMGHPMRHSLFRDLFGNKSSSKEKSLEAAKTLKDKKTE